MDDRQRPGAADDVAELTVPRSPRSVAAVRRFATAECVSLGWVLSVDTVALLVSEVAANAVLHARGPEVRVRVTVRAGRLRVEVDDASSDPPYPRTADAAAQDGRGLALVRALAHRTGYQQRAGGKTVWFELEA